MRVLAVDPGPHVGISLYDDRHIVGRLDKKASGYVERWDEWEETPDRFYAVVDSWIKWADVVVAEDFIISGPRAKKEANVTIEMIGVLRYLSALGHTRFVTQSPGDAKAFSTTTKLKALGWYKPAKADHARSATRHLVLHLSRENIITERLLHSVTEGRN